MTVSLDDLIRTWPASPQNLLQVLRTIQAHFGHIPHQAIDALVYQLYGLTPDEIALVESATAPQADATKETPSAEVSKHVAYDDQATAAAAHFHVEEEPPAKE